MGELILPLVSCVAVCLKERYLPFCSSSLMAGGRSDPKVMRAEDLVLPLIRCRIQETKPSTSPGEHWRVGPE